MVTVVYSLFQSEDLNIGLMNNVMRAGIFLFAGLSVLTIYFSLKSIIKNYKKSTDSAFSIICIIATLGAVIIYTPAMLNYFST